MKKISFIPKLLILFKSNFLKVFVKINISSVFS